MCVLTHKTMYTIYDFLFNRETGKISVVRADPAVIITGVMCRVDAVMVDDCWRNSMTGERSRQPRVIIIRIIHTIIIFIYRLWDSAKQR